MAEQPQAQAHDPHAELRNRFAYHPATEQTGPMHDEVRARCLELAEALHDMLPPGRHKSMALTSVQEAMWAANAAIACDTRREEPAGT